MVTHLGSYNRNTAQWLYNQKTFDSNHTKTDTEAQFATERHFMEAKLYDSGSKNSLSTMQDIFGVVSKTLCTL